MMMVLEVIVTTQVLQSLLRSRGLVGTEYVILVGGYGGDSGILSMTLTVSQYLSYVETTNMIL